MCTSFLFYAIFWVCMIWSTMPLHHTYNWQIYIMFPNFLCRYYTIYLLAKRTGGCWCTPTTQRTWPLTITKPLPPTTKIHQEGVCCHTHITLCIHQQDEVKRKTVLIWHLPNKSSFNVKRKELSKLESWLLYLPLTCSTRATRSSSFWSWVMSSKKRALKKHAYSTCLLPRCGVWFTILNFKRSPRAAVLFFRAACRQEVEMSDDIRWLNWEQNSTVQSS